MLGRPQKGGGMKEVEGKTSEDKRGLTWMRADLGDGS